MITSQPVVRSGRNNTSAFDLSNVSAEKMHREINNDPDGLLSNFFRRIPFLISPKKEFA